MGVMSGPTRRQSPGCPLALPLAATTTRKTKGNQSLGQETPRPRALSPSTPNKSTACALEAGMQIGCSHCHRAGDDRGSGADHGAPSTCTLVSTRAVLTRDWRASRSASDTSLSGQRGSTAPSTEEEQSSAAVKGDGSSSHTQNTEDCTLVISAGDKAAGVGGTRGREAWPRFRDACGVPGFPFCRGGN